MLAPVACRLERDLEGATIQPDGVNAGIAYHRLPIYPVGRERNGLMILAAGLMAEILNWRTRCGSSPWARQMRCTELTLMPVALAMTGPVQCVFSPGGAALVRPTTRSKTVWASGAMRGGRILSRSGPATRACMKRSCQRQTTDLLCPLLHDRRRPEALGGQQHDPAAPDMLLWDVAVGHDRFQPGAVDGIDGHRDFLYPRR